MEKLALPVNIFLRKIQKIDYEFSLVFNVIQSNLLHI